LDLRLSAVALVFLAACSTAPVGTEGHVDPDDVEKIMKAHADEFRACYEKSPGHQPGLVETRFRVDRSGQVIVAAVQMSTLQNPEAENCILDRIRGLSFPSPTDGGEAQVQYPFKFAPSRHK
jgi:hypothetical protein